MENGILPMNFHPRSGFVRNHQFSTHRLSPAGASPDALVASLSRVPAQEHRSSLRRPYHLARAQEMGLWKRRLISVVEAENRMV